MEDIVIILALFVLGGLLFVIWKLDRIARKVNVIDARLAEWEEDINRWAMGVENKSEKPSFASLLSQMPGVGNDEDFRRH